METKKKIQAYWVGDHLRYGDNRIPRKGRTHRVMGRPRLCCHGLHASVHPLDALNYAPCYTLWMVELSGEVVKGEDKLAATERTYIRSIDIREVARKFARWCALRAVKRSRKKACVSGVAYRYLLHGREEDRRKARGCALAEFDGNLAAEAAFYAANDDQVSAANLASITGARLAGGWEEEQAQRRKFKQLVQEAFANAS